MRSEELPRNTLVPLVLRITLALIFIYHGLVKITGRENEFGANWAATGWSQPAVVPADVLARLDALPEETPEKITEVKSKLQRLYAAERPVMPETLQPAAVQLAVAWGEFIGGMALLIGLLTRLAAAGQMIIQIGAIYVVTWHRGFSFAAGGGYEYNLSLLAMCLALVLLGGGTLSVDYLVRRKRKAAAKTTPAEAEHTASAAS